MPNYLLFSKIICTFASSNKLLMIRNNDLDDDKLKEIFMLSERKDGKLSLDEYCELIVHSENKLVFDYNSDFDYYYYYIPLSALSLQKEKEIYKLTFDKLVLSADETKILKFC